MTLLGLLLCRAVGLTDVVRMKGIQLDDFSVFHGTHLDSASLQSGTALNEQRTSRWRTVSGMESSSLRFSVVVFPVRQGLSSSLSETIGG